MAAAVLLPRHISIDGVNDSKKLTAKQREILADAVRRHALAVGIGKASPRLIERCNIRNATLHAMRLAIAQLRPAPEYVLIDGDAVPDISIGCATLIRGDARSYSIACASIIAKVYRDRLMQALAHRFPGYGFESNSGYGTAKHLQAISELGPCPLHRRSFMPVRKSFTRITT